MPKRVVGTDRDHSHVRFHAHPYPSASMMRDLQNVSEPDFRKTQFQIAGEKGRQVSGFQEEDDGVVVLSRFVNPPMLRRMEHPEIAKLLPSKNKPQRNVPPLSQLDEGSIGGDHRVPPQPDFTD